jgi:hypothetical protein
MAVIYQGLARPGFIATSGHPRRPSLDARSCRKTDVLGSHSYPLIRIFGDCGDQRIVIAFRSEGTPNADYTPIGIVWLMCGVRYRSRCSGVAWWRFSATRVMGARRLREGRGLLRR